jgi:hypothetical protein
MKYANNTKLQYLQLHPHHLYSRKSTGSSGRIPEVPWFYRHAPMLDQITPEQTSPYSIHILNVPGHATEQKCVLYSAGRI